MNAGRDRKKDQQRQIQDLLKEYPVATDSTENTFDKVEAWYREHPGQRPSRKRTGASQEEKQLAFFIEGGLHNQRLSNDEYNRLSRIMREGGDPPPPKRRRK